MQHYEVPAQEVAAVFSQDQFDVMLLQRPSAFVPFEYIRQMMTRKVSAAAGSAFPPKRLADAFPPHIIEDLCRIDWDASELPLSFALVSRLIWIWQFRFEQHDAHLHVAGDDHFYHEIVSALSSQLQRLTLSRTHTGGYYALVPY